MKGSYARAKQPIVRSVLFVSLSNIGDAVLTWPVLDSVWQRWPTARITAVAGPKAAPLFEGHPRIERVLVYNKRAAWNEKVGFLRDLRARIYDCVIDLRRSLIPWLVRAKRRPNLLWPAHGGHARTQHLEQFYRLVPDAAGCRPQPRAFHWNEADRSALERIWPSDVRMNHQWLLLSPGAADASKRWPAQRFAEVGTACHRLYGWRVVIVAADDEKRIAERVGESLHRSGVPHVNFAGRLNLRQLCAVAAVCRCAVTNDSGVMHIVSYFNRPVVALFGPTEPQRYGAWSHRHANLRDAASCARCRRPADRSLRHTCMDAVPSKSVLKIIRDWRMRGWV